MTWLLRDMVGLAEVIWLRRGFLRSMEAPGALKMFFSLMIAISSSKRLIFWAVEMSGLFFGYLVLSSTNSGLLSMFFRKKIIKGIFQSKITLLLTWSPHPSGHGSIFPSFPHLKPPSTIGSFTKRSPSISMYLARGWSWNVWAHPSLVVTMIPNMTSNPNCLALRAARRELLSPPAFSVLMLTAWATWHILW